MRTVTVIISTFSDEKNPTLRNLQRKYSTNMPVGDVPPSGTTAKIRPVNFAVVTGRDRPVVIPPPSPYSWVNNAEQ